MRALRAVEKWAEGWARACPVDEIDRWIGTGTRSRELSIVGLFYGAFMTMFERKSAFLTEIHLTLEALHPERKRQLGVPTDVSYRHVERLNGVIAKAFDPTRSDLSEDEVQRRVRLRSEIWDAVINASVPRTWRKHGSFAVDATWVESFSRPPRKSHSAADRDASWGWRRGKQPGQPDEKFFGFYEQVVVMVNDEGGSLVPELITGYRLTSASEDPPQTSIEMLYDLAERCRLAGGRVRDLLADSAYPYAVGWMMAIKAMGWAPVVDLNSNDLGLRATTSHGAISDDDVLLCPAIPKRLLELARPDRHATEAKWKTYFARDEERHHYEIFPHGKPDKEGNQRGKCGAHTGDLECPLWEASLNNPNRPPKVRNPPKDPPPVCTQVTITISPKQREKVRQKHRYYSRKWHASYDRRTAVERAFAWVKDPAKVDLRRGRVRLMGATKQGFMRVVGYCVANFRMLANFAAQQDDPSLRRRKPRREKLFTEALDTIRPVRHLADGPSPP